MIFFKQVLSPKVIFLCVLLLSLSTQAHALLISSATDALLTGDETSQAAINGIIGGKIGPSVELYKSNVGGVEEGPLAGSYDTRYSNTPSDPSEAVIEYLRGDLVGPTAFLLVKGGKAAENQEPQEPAWYLFDLTALGWVGTEDLNLYDFWPEKNAISHLSLYGNSGTSQPACFFLGLDWLFSGLSERRERGPNPVLLPSTERQGRSRLCLFCFSRLDDPLGLGGACVSVTKATAWGVT